MAKDISDEIKQLIFEHVDSVAQLEVLFLLRQNPEQWFTAEGIGKELRNSPDSVIQHLHVWRALGALAEKQGLAGAYRYQPGEPLRKVLDELADNYKVRQHRILELIFSPTKRARQFAKAFDISKKSDGEDNG